MNHESHEAFQSRFRIIELLKKVHKFMNLNQISSSSSSSMTQHPVPIMACLYPLVKWAWLSMTLCYHSRIISPMYGGTVYSGLEFMTGVLLSRTR